MITANFQGNKTRTCEKRLTSLMLKEHCICHRHQLLLPENEKKFMNGVQQFTQEYISAWRGAHFFEVLC